MFTSRWLYRAGGADACVKNPSLGAIAEID